MQYPVEVPGVSVEDLMTESLVAMGRDAGGVHAELAAEAERIGLATRLLDRPVNVDLSGGEKKRNETLQLAVLKPRFAVLDELDSGLDVDALRACARRIEAATTEFDLGVLAITHYHRLLDELRPDVVHILVQRPLVASGGPELAGRLEETGYAAWVGEDEEPGGRPAPRPVRRSVRRPPRLRPGPAADRRGHAQADRTGRRRGVDPRGGARRLGGRRRQACTGS